MENIKKITSPISKELKLFEEKLADTFDCVLFLKDELKCFLFNNPKRLRVIFTYLFKNILDIKEDEIVLNIALAQEIIHSASLIHDDILDNEKERRKNPTFYHKFGSKIALLEGDLLLSIALSVLSKTNSGIINIFSKKIEKTLQGEINQNINSGKILTIDEYIEKTYNKTANLFLAGLESLLSLKKTDTDKKNSLLDFIKNYSLAFQLKNDLDGLDKDIKNGNYTLTVIYYNMENRFKSIDKISKNDLKKYSIKVIEKIEEYKKNAINSILGIEDSIYKKSLIDLCNLV